MIVYISLFLLYLTVFIVILSLLIKISKWLNPPDANISAAAPPGEGAAYRTRTEPAETVVDASTSYPSPCLSCTRKIDAIACAGCTELKASQGPGTRLAV